MRKIFTLLTAVIAAICLPTEVLAYPMTLIVDNPEAITVKYYDESYVMQTRELQAGENTFEITSEWGSQTVYVNNGYIIKSIVGEQTGSSKIYLYSDGSMASITNAEDVFTITTASDAEIRTAEVTVNVDNPDKVKICRGNSYTPLGGIKAGENIIRFNPETEAKLSLQSASYEVSLYEVKHNGEVVSQQQYSNIVIEDGDVIDITAEWPAVPGTFTIICNDPDFIKSLTVEGESQELSFTDGSCVIDVTLPAAIALEGNTADFAVTKYCIDGVSQYGFYGTYSSTITKDCTVEFQVSKYQDYTATIIVDDPTNVSVEYGSYYDLHALELTAGENKYVYNSGSTPASTLTIKPESGCFITSVTLNGEAVDYNQWQASYSVVLHGDDVVEIVSGRISRDKTAVIYRDDASVTQYANFTRADRSNIEPTPGTGYSLVEFYDGDLPINASWYGQNLQSGSAKVYINNELTAAKYENTDNYDFTIADGDVIKIYHLGEPSAHALTFTIDENAGDVTATQDVITEITDFSAEYNVLDGTRIDITVDADKIEAVKYNDSDVEATDGVYSVTIDQEGAANIAIIAKDNDGINSISINNSLNNNVYNCQGILILRNANAEQLKSLPAGMYIIGGEKKIIR